MKPGASGDFVQLWPDPTQNSPPYLNLIPLPPDGAITPRVPHPRGRVAGTRSARTLLGFICPSQAPASPHPSPALSSLPACPNLVFALNIQTFQRATFKRFVIYHFQIVLDRDHNHVVT